MDIATFNQSEADQTREVEGIWKELGEGARVRVARAQNVKFVELLRKRLEPYDVAMQRGTMDEETGEKILCEVMAQTILLNMEGFQENKVPVQDTKENRTRFLKDYKSFRETIASISARAQNFKTEAEKTTTGNSEESLSGTSNGETN